MTLEELITKYIRGAERVFKEIGQLPEDVHLNKEEAKTVFDWAKRYLEDAKYYQKEGCPATVRSCGVLMVTKKKKRIVLASGTFDLLHLGHVRFLEEAKKAGGKDAELIVIVARDSTVKARKGKKPVMPEDQRRALVESLKVVDEAILGLEDFSIDNVIEKIKPDVIAVGHDQDGIEKEVLKAIEKEKFAIEVAKIGRFGKRELDSSSKIVRKIIESFNK